MPPELLKCDSSEKIMILFFNATVCKPDRELGCGMNFRYLMDKGVDLERFYFRSDQCHDTEIKIFIEKECN